MRRSSHLLLKVFICALIIILVLCAPARFENSDSRYNILPATSLIQHHTFYLDSYDIKNDFRIDETADHSLYAFPIGTAIVTLPIIAVLELLGVDTFKYDIYTQQGITCVCLICLFLVMARLYPDNILIPCIFFSAQDMFFIYIFSFLATLLFQFFTTVLYAVKII
ncbi:MAG: hypothetical protein LRY67_02665 [Gammaproteobacteria bacterium]|nr:hypothetical protein [Gammaproteobacteria bacterium]MCD8541943.1 hypothetical protein [Gammaproteobacteria bacterium]